MPLMRITFFYEQGENGWSESLHSTATDTPTLIALALGYSNQRMAFSSPETVMTHIRISDDQVFRDAILDPVPLPRTGQFKPNNGAEAPWVAFDLRLQANPQVTRSLFVRGFPAGQIDGNLPSFTPAFNTLYARYVQYIAQNAFGIKNKDRSQVKQPIYTVSLAGVVNMSVPVAFLANGDTVQILGVPRSVVPKRFYTVINLVDQSNFQLRGYAGPALTHQGYFRRIAYTILPINFTATDFVTKRGVGRPFGVQRGRRAVVR
jgi:hypothetical protein